MNNRQSLPPPRAKKADADERTARADTRLGVAVVCGLLLVLLATGDRAGVTEAYERFLARAPATAAPAPGRKRTPQAQPR